jgi:N,N'-diacetylchitobiose transport system substrate-binding protein
VKVRHLVVAGVAAALALSGCGSSSGNNSSSNTGGGKKTLKVWLMNGSAPQTVVDAVNAEFTKAHPNVDVKVELQQWDGIVEKVSTALASDTPPDVLEMGNTQDLKFAASGGLLDLTSKKTSIDTSSSWLAGLEQPGTLDGKLYGVPYYAGARAVIYNKDLFQQAGITAAPTSRDELSADLQKLQAKFGSDPQFSAIYFPGKYWYGSLPFIWDEGGDLAVKDGSKWKGNLDSSQSVAGLNWLKDTVSKYSKAPKDGDETTDAAAFETGKVGMILDPGWQIGVITKDKPELKDKIGAFAVPSKSAGKDAPNFLGGSNLGISQASKNQNLALDWLKIATGKTIQTQFANEGGVIPNSVDALSGVNRTDPLVSVFDKAAKTSKSTPASPNWANVESGTVLQDMLVSIFSGQSSVQDAAKKASDAITDTLNKS